MTDVGSVIYDKDSTFLEVGGASKDSLTQYGIEDKRTPLLNELKGIRIEEQEHESNEEFRLFSTSQPMHESSLDDEPRLTEEPVEHEGRIRRRVVFNKSLPEPSGPSDGEDSDDDAVDDEDVDDKRIRLNRDDDADQGEDLAFEETDSELEDEDGEAGETDEDDDEASDEDQDDEADGEADEEDEGDLEEDEDQGLCLFTRALSC